MQATVNIDLGARFPRWTRSRPRWRLVTHVTRSRSDSI